MVTGLVVYGELSPSMQENKIEYIEADETEMDDMEDFEGLLKGEDSSISYVIGPVVVVNNVLWSADRSWSTWDRPGD